MADGVAVAMANSMLAVLTTSPASGFVQLHTGPPGPSGTSNVSSVTVRQALTWGSPSAGIVTASSQPQWTNWAGTSPETETDISFWTAVSSGTFGMSMQLAAPVTTNTGDTVLLTALQVSILPAS